MINLNEFRDFHDSYIFGQGSDLQEVQAGFKSAPSWLPEDYKQIFTQCDRWALVGVELFSPLTVPYSTHQRGLTLNQEFHENCPDHDDFFAIGELGDDAYLVIQHLDTENICGYYHAGDREWFGKRFPSVTAWAYACLEAQGDPNE